MDRRDPGEIADAKPGPSDLPAPVDVLEIEEIVFIERPGGGYHVAVDQPARPGHPVYILHPAFTHSRFPRGSPLTVSEVALTPLAFPLSPGGGKLAPGQAEAAVLVDLPRSQNPRRFSLGVPLNQGENPCRLDPAVCIQDEVKGPGEFPEGEVY
jgi:hypothetical protein